MKKKQTDMDNFGRDSKVVAKGLKQADDFKVRNRNFEPVKQDYNPREMANKNLSSGWDYTQRT